MTLWTPSGMYLSSFFCTQSAGRGPVPDVPLNGVLHSTRTQRMVACTCSERWRCCQEKLCVAVCWPIVRESLVDVWWCVCGMRGAIKKSYAWRFVSYIWCQLRYRVRVVHKTTIYTLFFGILCESLMLLGKGRARPCPVRWLSFSHSVIGH